MSTSQRTALVTGASSGIGEAIGRRLAADGLVVYGTSRRPGTTEGMGPMRPLALDVTDDASVTAAIAAIQREAGRLDVVVNNAGATLLGAIEKTSADEARALFKLNVLGAHRVTRAALPLLRAGRGGHVVFIGSIAGFLPKPGEGFYSATKHALEAYAEVLRTEVKTSGIHVSLVEPGFVRTGLASRSTFTEARMPEYKPLRGAARRGLQADIAKGAPPEQVAAAVARIVASARPRRRHLVGADAHVLRWVRSVLPESLFAMGLRRQFGLDRGR